MFGISKLLVPILRAAESIGSMKSKTSVDLFSFQTMNFSKYISKSRARRLPLTTKQARKGYKKGNGCRREGTINSRGKSICHYSLECF